VCWIQAGDMDVSDCSGKRPQTLQDLFARTSKERTIRAFKRGPLTRYRQDLRRRTFERI
jgi:hypothetical protein